MVKTARQGWAWMRWVLTSPPVILLSTTLAFAAFGYSVQANDKVADEANQRSKDAEGQSAYLRETFCGLVEPIAVQGEKNIAATALGAAIIAEARRTVNQLKCTPDPFDHQ